MTTLAEIESAVVALSPAEKQELMLFLASCMGAGHRLRRLHEKATTNA
ncbi:MAG: hypothetical protein WCQ77_03885 [Planctomycetota bacterium]